MKKYFPSSELIINEDGSVFHLHVKPEWLADKVILVGDPGRVALVASHFENKECEVESREFKTITGTYKGKRITVVSTGIGCDNIDIVMNELDALANIDFVTREEKDQFRQLELVRIGTCGGLQPNTPVGTFVCSQKSIMKGKSGSELSHSPQLKENYKKMSWKHDFIYKLFETFYINYTVGQEAWTPKFQHMMNIIREKYNGQAPEWFRKAFRTKSLPLMKYTNMLSFNTRVIALFVSLFIDMPWLYFAFELTVLNSMLLYMIKKHEHICEDFSKQL